MQSSSKINNVLQWANLLKLYLLELASGNIDWTLYTDRYYQFSGNIQDTCGTRLFFHPPHLASYLYSIGHYGDEYPCSTDCNIKHLDIWPSFIYTIYMGLLLFFLAWIFRPFHLLLELYFIDIFVKMYKYFHAFCLLDGTSVVYKVYMYMFLHCTVIHVACIWSL